MKNRQIIAVLLSMILIISLCLPTGSSVFAAETYSEEAAEPVDNGSTEAVAEEETIVEGSEEEAGPEEGSKESEEEDNSKEEDDLEEWSFPEEEGDFEEGNFFEEEEEVDEADEDIVIIEEAEKLEYQPGDTKSADDLFAGYVDMEFGIREIVKPGFGAKRTTAGSKLKSDTLLAYTRISRQLPLLAAGEITSTVFTISEADLGFTKVRWSAEDLGVYAIAEDGKLTQDAKDAATARLKEEYFNLSLLLDALLADYPYLLYWYDKTQTTRATGYRFSAVPTENGYDLTFAGDMILQFPVAEAYSAGEYTVDASIGQTVRYSVENAQDVVAKYAPLPDYEKIVSYRQEICNLTSYNFDAIADDAPYGDPWQLIWVFDKDPDTSVVCEGYAKAFKYLCDQSSFTDDIDCKSVTGTINNGKHMWNIVTMEDGENYLVDVTSCDTGMIGEDDKLFLVGTAGSPKNGYKFTIGNYNIVIYNYDEDMKSLWSSEELTLSEHNYMPYSVEDAVVFGIEDKVYTGEEISQQIVVEYDGETLTENTDYTVSYENNINAGTARVIIEGTGSFQGTVTREFTIEKAEQALSVVSEKIINGRTITVTATGAQGDLSYALTGEEIAQITSDDGAGKIKVKGNRVGTALLTVTASETQNYNTAVFETELRVVPAAPSHVEVTNVASGLKISWNGVTGARCYRVYRGEEFLFETSRLYATDTAVKPYNGTKYTYKVFASSMKDNEDGVSTICRTGTGYRLTTVGITALTNPAAGKMSVSYAINDKSTGYVIRYGLEQDMSDAKVITVQGAQTHTRVLGGVIKGKTYYVQVRAYILENGKRYYSGYCTTRKVKITK